MSSRLALALVAAVVAAAVAAGASATPPPVSPSVSPATLAALPQSLLAGVPPGQSLLGADTTSASSKHGAVTPMSGTGACVTYGTSVERSSNTVVFHGETTCTTGSHINAFGGCIYRDGFTVVACNYFPIYFSGDDASLAIVGSCASGLHSYWASGTVNWTPLGGSSRTYPWSTPITSTIIC